MSDLLNQASLVVIPSGYKEDTVYSVVPSDGSGDLSFTRASNGTRINSAGLVEVTPWNLLEYSNAFNTAPWSMNVTSGQAGKDGQNNAWLLTKASATSSDYYLNNVYNGDQTFTIYVKKESSKGFKLYPIGTTTTSTEVNLQTGVVLNQGAGITSTTVEAYSSTWWKISVALNMINSNYYIYVTDGAGTQIASSITIQDAQVNIGLTAKPYFPTTDRLNVPRLTYQNGGGGCPSLLLEKQSTNLFTYSEQIDNAAWFYNNLTITANQAISPDGTQNADLLDDGTASSTQHWIYQGTSFSNSTAYTISFYAKYVSRQYMTVNIYNGSSSQYVAYNIQNGTILGSTGDVTASITSVGNGRYRIVYTRTMAASGSPNFRIGLADDTGSETYTGSNKQVYVWGFQCEASSYPTSYIPTTSSSATRVADACSKTGISSLIGQSEGTIYWEGYVTPVNNWNSLASVEVLSVRFINLRLTTTNMIELGSTGLSTDFTITSSTPAVLGTYYKIAGAYKSGQNVLYVNGVQIGTSATTFTTPTLSEFRFDVWNVFNEQKSVAQAVLFPTRLTNAELASLTTI